MHPRNSHLFLLLIVFLSLVIGGAAQTATPPQAAPTSAQPAQGQTAPSQSPPSSSAPTSTPVQAAPSQPVSNAPSQAPAPGPGNAPASAPQSQPAAPQVQPQPQGQSAQPGAVPQGQQPDAGAQQGAPPEANDSGVFVFKKEVDEVVLHATVIDDKQRMITNLDKGAFTIYENGQPQPITSFRHEDIPVAMAIVIDNSGSMREKRQKVNAAALNLVRSSNPQDQVFVVNFNDEYYLDQDFTSNINQLKEALDKIEARGGTALYDAVVASADHLKKNAKLERKVLFVVTDGEDNASRESLEQAVRRLQEENGPTVYAIGILGEEKARRARRALQTMAERTGGIAFLPKTLDEVDAISRSVAHDIRNQYTIGYKPTTPKSAGGYRTIKVDARAHGYNRLTVRTKSGYYAGQERASSGTH